MKPKCPFKEIDIVYWQDAYVTTEDSPKLEHKNTLTISIGVIVEEKDGMLHMSHFWDGISESFQSPFTSIPKGMVKCQRKIKI